MYGVIRYPVIALPPSEAGAVQVSATEALRDAPVTPVGAPGTAAGAGVTGDEAVDSAPVPEPLVAATVNVYVVPFVSPVTVRVVAVDPVLMGV